MWLTEYLCSVGSWYVKFYALNLNITHFYSRTHPPPQKQVTSWSLRWRLKRQRDRRGTLRHCLTCQVCAFSSDSTLIISYFATLLLLLLHGWWYSCNRWWDFCNAWHFLWWVCSGDVCDYLYAAHPENYPRPTWVILQGHLVSTRIVLLYYFCWPLFSTCLLSKNPTPHSKDMKQ